MLKAIGASESGATYSVEPGMVFALEPNACIGNHHVEHRRHSHRKSTGCEELNHIPTRVAHKQ
jgi:hypothetical protein